MRALNPSSLVVLVGLSLCGCSDGGGGDTLGAFKGDVLGQGRSLASINALVQADGSPNQQRPGANEIVSVTGARVTWVDRYDETGNGKGIGNIFLQDFTDPAGPFEGVLAFQSSYSPPSFRTSVGDVVDITGRYVEFQLADANKGATANWTTPEFTGGNIALRFDAPYIPIVPVEIAITDLANYTTGRQWLSMVVTARNVKISNKPATSGGRTTIDLFAGAGISTSPQITNELFDLKTHVEKVALERGVASVADLEVASITGIVTVAFQFHIAPRSADDIVFK